MGISVTRNTHINEREKVMETTMEKAVTMAKPKAEVTVPGLTERQILNRLHKLDAIKKQMDELKKEMEAIKSEIMGNAEAVTIDSEKFKLDAGKEAYKSFDSTAFKKDQPDVYKSYVKVAFRSKFRFTFK